jgi:hypothetical protein
VSNARERRERDRERETERERERGGEREREDGHRIVLVSGVPAWYMVYLHGIWCTCMVYGVPAWYMVYMAYRVPASPSSHQRALVAINASGFTSGF